MAEKITISGVKVMDANYGENPWQASDGLFLMDGSSDPLAIGRFELVQGREPSYNNIGDIDRLVQTATHIAAAMEVNGQGVPSIALGAKHGNMCGAAIAPAPETAVEQMLEGNLLSIFGGATLTNFAVTESVANTLMKYKIERGKRLLDVIVGSEVDAEALEILSRKEGKLRVMSNEALGRLTVKSLDTAPRFRYVRGSLQQQQNYTYVPDFRSAEWLEHNEAPNRALARDLILGWAVGSTSTSNTISLVRDGMLIGNGVGQQDRVGAAKLAIQRAEEAGHSVEGAVAYSDSFFPFPDGPQILIDAGVSAIYATIGSVKFEEIRKVVTDAGVKFFGMPDTESRGFYGH